MIDIAAVAEDDDLAKGLFYMYTHILGLLLFKFLK